MARVIVKGADVHRNRLRRLRSKYLQDPINRALYDQGEAIRADAQASIRAGAVSGPGHVPSAPGTPPNADTHNLDLSIDVRLTPDRKKVVVAARAHYAAAQEFGTSKLPARPYMRPALRRSKRKVVQAVANTVRGESIRVRRWQSRG